MLILQIRGSKYRSIIGICNRSKIKFLFNIGVILILLVIAVSNKIFIMKKLIKEGSYLNTIMDDLDSIETINLFLSKDKREKNGQLFITIGENF